MVELEREAQEMEVLTFRLGTEEYGIDILKVQEIREYERVTHIAGAPDFIKGVINLRGMIVPIIDMRIKLNIGTPAFDQFTVVVILNVGEQVIGMVVDGVSEVVTLTPEKIKPAPAMHTSMNAEYLIGFGAMDERMLILVDIDKLMSSCDMGLIQKLAA